VVGTYVAEPAVAVGIPGDLVSLNVSIGDLDVQIADLQRGAWFRGRDERIHELIVRRDRCRDRVAHWRR
jgi:hypothetical protein